MNSQSGRTCRRSRRAWRGRCAAEVLELALALPLLLLLAFGTVEFGYWFYLEHNFQAAAREGARAAVVKKTLLEQQLAAETAADDIMAELKIPKDKYEVTATPVGNGEYIKVEVTADWKEVGVETGLFIGAAPGGRGEQTELVKENAKIIGTATMRIEL
jgi:Flp pilus assembly protein TadG